MALEPDEPLTQKPAPKNLEGLSLEELQDYIGELEAEIGRARKMIETKKSIRGGAVVSGPDFEIIDLSFGADMKADGLAANQRQRFHLMKMLAEFTKQKRLAAHRDWHPARGAQESSACGALGRCLARATHPCLRADGNLCRISGRAEWRGGRA